MANPLGELFQNIANAIRGKTGDADKMAPAAFPEAIDSIDQGPMILPDVIITPDFAEGDCVDSVPDGYAIQNFTVKKPDTLVPENIVEGVNIAGIVGSASVGTDLEILEDVPVEVDFSEGDFEISVPEGYAVKSATVLKPENLKPEYILEGVTIAGITGSAVAGPGGSSADVRYVTFMSFDGTEELFKRAVLSGNDCGDVVELGLISAPTVENTNEATYTRIGWATQPRALYNDTNALKKVTEDRVVYAAFDKQTRYYTVRFFDGDELKYTRQVAYNGSVVYELEKEGYIFQGWSPSNTNITKDTDCYAQWKKIEIPVSVSLIERTLVGDYYDDMTTATRSYALSNMPGITSVVFTKVTSINQRILYDTTELEKIDLHQPVSLAAQAFTFSGSRDKLTAIILRGTTMSTIANANSINKAQCPNMYIYVPAALVDSYKTTSIWSNFSSLYRAIEDYPDICGG